MSPLTMIEGKMRYLILLLLLLPSVAVAEHMGYETVGTADDHSIDSYVRYNGFTMTEDGTLDSLVVYIVQCGGACYQDVKLGLYSNDDGDPGDLLDQTAAFNPTENTWNQHAVLTGVSLTSGTTYWIAGIAEDIDPEIPYNELGTELYENDNNGWSWPNLPDPAIPDGSSSHRTYSWYAVYTPTGGDESDTPVIMIHGED